MKKNSIGLWTKFWQMSKAIKGILPILFSMLFFMRQIPFVHPKDSTACGQKNTSREIGKAFMFRGNETRHLSGHLAQKHYLYISLYNKYMSRIKIKNFGPIKATTSATDGWIDISKVTVFTGNQGSGKSTVAKLVSTFT